MNIISVVFLLSSQCVKLIQVICKCYELRVTGNSTFVILKYLCWTFSINFCIRNKSDSKWDITKEKNDVFNECNLKLLFYNLNTNTSFNEVNAYVSRWLEKLLKSNKKNI